MQRHKKPGTTAAAQGRACVSMQQLEEAYSSLSLGQKIEGEAVLWQQMSLHQR
jgi:hypothetical protein